MRVFLILMLGSLAAAAKDPTVRIVNLTNPSSNEFQVGDRYEFQVTGLPVQPVSIRTIRTGQIEWGIVVGWTDQDGHFSMSSQFEKSDFGTWDKFWTVGSQLSARVSYRVNAPCLANHQAFHSHIGLHEAVTCDASQPDETFTNSTPVASHPETQDDYYSKILGERILAPAADRQPFALMSSTGGLGDRTAFLIFKLIGVNALTPGLKPRTFCL